MQKMTAPARILVWFKKSGDKPVYQAQFLQSIVDVLNEDADVGFVYAQLENNKLLLSRDPIKPNDNKLKIKRPSFCPIHHISQEQVKELPQNIVERGIDCGVATVLESGDGKVLLTRRAFHLRTFPGVWVPPGGHIEANESFLNAALRELQEETGLTIQKEWCENQNISTLAVWESVFPPKLSAGLPKRHHAVIYLHAKLLASYTAEKLQNKLNLDPQEVGASAWLDRNIIEAIVKTSEYEEKGEVKQEHTDILLSKLPKEFQATVISPEEKVCTVNIQSSVLLNVATGDQEDCERVSTGTKFALSEWLKQTK